MAQGAPGDGRVELTNCAMMRAESQTLTVRNPERKLEQLL